jgi:hypothetical protein
MKILGAMRWLVAGVLLAGTVACTAIIPPGGPPTIIQSTPFGSNVISQGGQLGGGSIGMGAGGLAAPPAGLDPDLPGQLPVMPGGRDGIYSGVAVPLNTGGGLCITNQPIDGFRVTGDRVRWGSFRGRIRGDALQMVQGNTWVMGQFEGNRFNGQITQQSLVAGPGCTFMVALAKTGE